MEKNDLTFDFLIHDVDQELRVELLDGAAVLGELRSDVRRGVLDVVDLFGGWLWSDGGPSPIYHLDGRKFLSHAERDVRGIRDTKDVRYRLAAAACQDQGKLMADNTRGNHPAAAAAAAAQRAQQFLRFLAGVANANCKCSSGD